MSAVQRVSSLCELLTQSLFHTAFRDDNEEVVLLSWNLQHTSDHVQFLHSLSAEKRSYLTLYIWLNGDVSSLVRHYFILTLSFIQ